MKNIFINNLLRSHFGELPAALCSLQLIFVV